MTLLLSPIRTSPNVCVVLGSAITGQQATIGYHSGRRKVVQMPENSITREEVVVETGAKRAVKEPDPISLH